MKTDRRTKMLYLVTGLIVLAATVALVLFARRGRQPSPESSVRQEKDAVPEKYRVTVAQLEKFQMTIPIGWARVEERESGDSAISLMLKGPIMKGQNLVIAVQTIPVKKGVTLDGFVESFTSDWPMQEFPMDRDIRFCDQDARMVGFTNEDGDNLVVMFIHEQTGYVIVSIAPEAAMPECWQIFYDVLQGFQLYQ